MPFGQTRRNRSKTVRFESPGRLGVDINTADGLLPDGAMRRLEHMRLDQMGLARRPGSARIFSATENTGSYTFGADTKYASIATASQLLIPTGGFAFHASFVATRPASGKTAFLISSIPAGQTYNVFFVSLNSAGLLSAGFRDTTNTDYQFVTNGAITNNQVCALLVVVDSVAGTMTAYLNGAQVSIEVPVAGLPSTIQPIQTPTNWTVGVAKVTGGAVTADSFFPGAIDALTLYTLRGTRFLVGTTSLADRLRTETFREWPLPSHASVLFHYDLNEASGTVMTDRSRFKNHGAYVGTPTATAKVAYSRPVSNFCGSFRTALGKVVNLYAAGGSLYYQVVRGGTA